MAAEVAQRAPDFTRPAVGREKTVSSEECTNEGPVVLFSRSGGWSGACPDQMSRVRGYVGRFAPLPHRAFVEDRGIEALLSDFGGAVTGDYGARHERGFPERSYFVIDRAGVVRTQRVEPGPESQSGPDGVLKDREKALRR